MASSSVILAIAKVIPDDKLLICNVLQCWMSTGYNWCVAIHTDSESGGCPVVGTSACPLHLQQAEKLHQLAELPGGRPSASLYSSLSHRVSLALSERGTISLYGRSLTRAYASPARDPIWR